MTGAMAHRGPDGINHWVNGSVALGQCMLRTTPESLEETQPLANEDESLVLVMDGRVDNFEDMRRELLERGATLRTRSDAELVLHAYELWGDQCANRIIGECVFFVWDARRKRLLGARDVAGTRHFYYHCAKGWFAFASEIDGLLALSLIPQSLNESRVVDYLVPEFDRDDEVGTFYQGIDRIPAGHCVCVSTVGLRVWRYWNPTTLSPLKFSSLVDWEDDFLARLRVAIRCRLRCTGRVGAMLSGGLDSSSIVTLISKEMRSQLDGPLRTFSLIRHDRENCPEWRAIRHLLSDGWFDSTVLTSDVSEDTCKSFIKMAISSDQPFTFSHGLGIFLLSNAAEKNGCKVLIDGVAGDLLFFDLDESMKNTIRARRYLHLLSVLKAYRRHDSKEGLVRLSRRAASLLAGKLAPAAVARRRQRRAPNFGERKWLKYENLGWIVAAKHSEHQRRKLEQDVDDPQLAHAAYFTSGLLSFAHEIYGEIMFRSTVEPRSPFSDRRIVECAIRSPLEAKLSLGWYKNSLRRLMKGVLPQALRWRRDIGGHPGWAFYDCVIKESVDVENFLQQEIGNGASLLTKWVDLIAMKATLPTDRYGTGFAVLRAKVLHDWLVEHWELRVREQS
jgi:asparagine synthase (glutamine-hydrolysing)